MIEIRCTEAQKRRLIYRDGFIGFAGWADDGNTSPIKRAFMRWCDALAEGKRGVV